MTSGHDDIRLSEFSRHGPLAYLYASTWEPGDCDCESDPQLGHYDAVTQTWIGPDEVITAGVCTGTRTTCNGADQRQDDACF